MRIIGREKEQSLLEDCLRSRRPEFLAVYGRWRVGKTYLIKEYFNNHFTFYATGVPNEKTSRQLRFFHQSLLAYGHDEKKAPKDWLEAFSRLRMLLENPDARKDPVSGKKIVFLDELPWMDTARSDFRSALEYFWNTWGSSQEDLFFIVCGSATSWMIKHILANRGGLYNRVTRIMYLQPFSLKECEEFFQFNGIALSRTQIMECYMIFGGIPFYLNSYTRRYSLAQNIDSLYYDEKGSLHCEYERLFSSLFKKPSKHLSVLEALAEKRTGMNRKEIAAATEIADGGATLTSVLSELEQCGFIRKYKDFTKASYGSLYQVIDPFLLFCLYTRKNKEIMSWSAFTGSPGYHAWCGLAFELVCLLHLQQIKKTLGISGVDTSAYSWRSKSLRPDAQVNLLIDRRDQVINLCEMKYTQSAFRMDAAYEKTLLDKKKALVEESHTRKFIHLTIVSANGFVRNEYAGMIQNVITGDDLFQ